MTTEDFKIPLPPVTGIDPAIWTQITDPARAATAVIVFEVNNSNPNAPADPDLPVSMPRLRSDGHGFMSIPSQCRPIYDALHEAGYEVFLVRGVDRKARNEALKGKSLPDAYSDSRIRGCVDLFKDERYGAALSVTPAESVLPLVSDTHNAIAEIKIGTTSYIGSKEKEGKKSANLMSTFVVEHMLYRGTLSWTVRNARALGTTRADLDAALRALVVGWRDGVRSNARADVSIKHLYWWSWPNAYAGEDRHRTAQRVVIAPKSGVVFPMRADQWDISVDVGDRGTFADLARMFD